MMKCSRWHWGAFAMLSLAQGCSTSHAPRAIPAAPPTATAMTTANTEVAPDKDVPVMAGQPLTSVVVTQCNLIVAVYMTMPDGRLLRFDRKASVPAEQLIQLAYTATRSERVEVSCDEDAAESAGVAVGYERHEPI